MKISKTTDWWKSEANVSHISANVSEALAGKRSKRTWNSLKLLGYIDL